MSTATNPSSSEMLESRQAAVKNRIITHLNADHAFSLQIYLQHYCGVPEAQAQNAKITDITNDHMILQSRAGRNLIPFNPPMKSLMEAREKTVAMHHEALKGLGLSSTTIKSFAWPNKVWQAGTNLTVFWCLVSLPLRSKILPSSGSFISQIWSLGGLAPGLAKFTYMMAPWVLPLILVIHSLEAENFARTRLRKHRVPAGSLLWCMWIVHAFIGGIACFTRFDELVRQTEEEAKKSEKH